MSGSATLVFDRVLTVHLRVVPDLTAAALAGVRDVRSKIGLNAAIVSARLHIIGVLVQYVHVVVFESSLTAPKE